MKILIIRFSSIGDVVLTSPILRCLKKQKKCIVHYLIKRQYKEVIENNSYIDKIHVIDQKYKQILPDLKSEKFDFVIDLQNNFKSFIIRKRINSKTYTVQKANWHKFLLIYLRIDLLKNHVLDRYFKCVESLGVYNDKEGLDFDIPSNTYVDYDVSKPFIVWNIGASFNKKKLSSQQIAEVCNRLNNRVVIIGGVNDKELALSIMKSIKNDNVVNFCGHLSISQAAYLLKESSLVLTNDTGLMHIAAAYNKRIISFWGCTKPIIGFTPLIDERNSRMILSENSKYPCSKHGKYCRFQSDGCIKTISIEDIYESVIKLGV